jgi:hypothetical protein
MYPHNVSPTNTLQQRRNALNEASRDYKAGVQHRKQCLFLNFHVQGMRMPPAPKLVNSKEKNSEVLLLQAHHWGVGYPLRPEVVESAYLLYSATQRPRHLRAGMGILETLWTQNRCKCGFCAVGNVTAGAASLPY